MEPIRDPEQNEADHLFELGRLDNARVLEIGCGNGRLTWRYASLPALIIGVDPDPERLEMAVANRPHARAHNVSFVAGSAETLPFDDQSFEVAILSWSL